MTAIDLHSAPQLASEAIIAALAAEMQTELAVVKAATYNAALPLASPAKYFEVLSEGTVDTEVRNSGRVACFVYQSSEFVVDEYMSNDPTDRQAIGRVEFGIVVAFHMTPYEPWSKPWGEPVTTEEVMTQRGRAYSGGVINTVLKYGCTQPGIEGVELQDNAPASVEFNEDGQPVMGYSHTSFSIIQHVKWPSPQALPA